MVGITEGKLSQFIAPQQKVSISSTHVRQFDWILARVTATVARHVLSTTSRTVSMFSSLFYLLLYVKKLMKVEKYFMFAFFFNKIRSGDQNIKKKRLERKTANELF